MVIQIFFFFKEQSHYQFDLLVLLAHEEHQAGGQVFKIGLA